MASKNTTVETVEAAQLDEAEPIVYAAITRMVEAHGVSVQHARYKAMRAIAYQAFVNAIEDGTFDALVDQAIDNAGNLPTGWKIASTAAAPKAPAAKKAAPATRTTKPAATTRTRKPAAKAEA